MGRLSVRRGFSAQHDAEEAIDELCERIWQPDASLAILFVSPAYDLPTLGRAIAARFACPVLACTTAGEIGPDGYREGSICGATLASPELAVRTTFISSLTEFTRRGTLDDALTSRQLPHGRQVALLMLDGISMREDAVVAILQARLGSIPLVGGSAGDGLDFRQTHVYYDGAFHAGAGVVACLDTTLPFTTFMLQHFEPTNERLVITDAEPETRRVLEINGLPAATEYARIVGVPRSALSLDVFAAHPVMLRAGGRHYVRSIQCANPDDSLSCYAAIDVGLVLTLARPTDLLASLSAHLSLVQSQVPDLSLVLGFDCLLRRQELQQAGATDRARDVLAPYPFIGASTYGEQFNGVHTNHTLTGLALGG